MPQSLKLLVSYSSVRIILYVVLAVLFAFFFARVLAKRSAGLRALSVALLAAFILGTAFFPVENVFMRFGTPEAAVGYSLPNQEVLQVLPHGDWAAVVCKDKRTVFVRKDVRGWMASSPAFVGWGVRWGFIENVSYTVRQLSDGIYYVGVNYRKYMDPDGNKGSLLIDSLTDSDGAQFVAFQREVLDKQNQVYATDQYYYAFVDAGSKDYHFVINGQDRPFD